MRAGPLYPIALLLAPIARAQTQYCTSGWSSIGCTPQISANAQPNVSSTSGCVITTLGVESQRAGLTFYGVDNSGFTPTLWAPLSTSYLCVKPPTARLGIANSGGTSTACTGVLAFSWDGFRAANPSALGTPWTVGDKVYAQTWYRDPLAARGTNLSNALELTLQPTTAIPCMTQLPGVRLISSGSFSMGSAEPFASPYFSLADEKPVRQVTISYCFWMGEREVSQAEYIALMGSLPNAPAFPNPAQPVENITWQAARNYCNALTAQQTPLGNVPPGYQYRLPTEAEWEYACRAGTTSEFHYGAALSCSQARITFSYHPNGNCGVNSITTVGTHLPNPWGLFDMHGNVSEWCLDAYSAYSPNNVTDPLVSVGVNRVVRGGSWADTSSNARSASRSNANPLLIYNNIGFRVVLAPIIYVP